MTWAEWKGSGRGLILKTFPAKLALVDRERRRIRIRITMTQADRDKEVVVASGAKLDAFRANPIVLYMHRLDLPIGIVTELELFDDAIVAEVQFTPEDNPHFGALAEGVLQLYATGFMRAASIGFLPIEVTERQIVAGQEGRAFLEWELLELSLVTVPSLREALVTDAAAALAVKGILADIDRALVVAARRRPPVDPVRQEFLATLDVLERAVDELRYQRLIDELDRARVLIEIIAIEEAMEGWR